MLARRLSAKLIVTQIAFLAIALGSIGLTLLFSWRLEGSAAAINDAGSLRYRAWRLAYLAAQDEPARTADEGAEIRRHIGEFDAVFSTLRSGDPTRPLFLPANDDVSRQVEALDAQWRNLKGRLEGASRGGPAPARFEVEGFVDRVNRLVVTIEEDIARTTAVLRYAQFALVALAIAGTVTLMYLSFLLVIRPLARLNDGIEVMAAGDLTVRVPVETRDEFGQVTAGFNQMAERLEGVHRTLEARVEEKTRTLAERTARLQTLYDMAAFLNLPQSKSQMCDGFLARAQQAFGASAAGLRLTAPDGTLHFYAARDVAPEVIGREECIRIGECACGDALGRGKTVVRWVDRPHPESWHDNCRDAGYACVVATPVEAHGAPLGVFNLFFRESRLIGHDERHLLDTLAQHLGAALEAARLGALEKEVALSEERNLLAQELHDSIAQSLAFLNLQVQMLASAMKHGNAERAQSTLGEIRDGVQECYGDVRELMHHFRTRLAPDDLRNALATMLASFERRTGIAARLVATGSGVPLDPDRQLQALHVVQEALSNARKHSGCRNVEVTLESGAECRIRVHDDGRGFDPDIVGEIEDHVGLRIMRERATRAGGRVEVRSRPGAGTDVVLVVPAAAEVA